MHRHGWLLLLLFVMGLTACAPTEPPQTEAPNDRRAAKSPAATTDAPLPTAALRRDLRVCETVAPDRGHVEYGVVVAPDGTVRRVQALDSDVSAALLNCSIQRLRAWRFSQSDRGASFEFAMTYGEEPTRRARPGGPYGRVGSTERVRPGEQNGRGDKRAIKAVIKHRSSELQHCYNELLRDSPDASGKVALAIVIAVSGEVTSVEAEESTVPPVVLKCIRAKVLAWTFPMDGATEEANVSFSVVFMGS